MREPAVELLLAFDAFLQEHRRCGMIDGSSEGPYVWLSCSCSGLITRVVDHPRLGSAEQDRTGSADA